MSFFAALTTHCQPCLAAALAPISEGAMVFLVAQLPVIFGSSNSTILSSTNALFNSCNSACTSHLWQLQQFFQQLQQHFICQPILVTAIAPSKAGEMPFLAAATALLPAISSSSNSTILKRSSAIFAAQQGCCQPSLVAAKPFLNSCNSAFASHF
jgi:hypothetical protein